MEKEDLITLFESYLAGHATAGEVKQLLRYFKQEKESEILTELVVKEMAQPAFTDELTLNNRQPVYQRVQDALRKRIEKNNAPVVIPLWRKASFRIAAAAAILVFFVGFFGIRLLHKHSELIAVNVPNGKIREIILPDSSHVWVNAGSQLQYPTAFKGKVREVYLEGQAFFQVIHEASHPFIVHSGRIVISVLGTSFEVKSFQKENEAKITVATGKVGVSLAGVNKPAIFLLAGQQAVIYKGPHIVKQAVQNEIAAWRESKLVFDNESLENVFHALERKYNVHFKILTPSLLNEVTSMKLDNQPLSDVLTVLSFSKHFNYQFANDSTVVIK